MNWLVGPSLKSQQAMHQAGLKLSGNTSTANGNAFNIALFATVLGGGVLLVGRAIPMLIFGRGKYEVDLD